MTSSDDHTATELGPSRLLVRVQRVCGDALEDLVQAMRDHVFPPLMLPPDGALAKTAPRIGVAYERCLDVLEEHLRSLNPAELAEVRDHLPWDLADHGDTQLASAIIEVATRDGFYALDPAVLTAADPEQPLYRSHPELLQSTDDDGLLNVSGFDARPQILMHGGSAVHYHPFLRRGFASFVNDSLTQTLLETASTGAATLRLALNEQHFMPATAFGMHVEADRWWGPPLSTDVLDDPHKLGVTAHGDFRSGPLHEYPRLFVDWAMNKEGHKVVQVEELSDASDSHRLGLRLMRYLHAIRDIERGVFIHCDGAVRAYTPAQYKVRTAKEFITGRDSASGYRKAFRLDGAIETSAWSNVAVRWFRGNRLMGEYLETLTGAELSP